MKSINKLHQTTLVWSFIFGLFAVLTVLAINLDRIRNSSLFNRKNTNNESVQYHNRFDAHEPGYSVVLNQPIGI